MPHTLAAAIEVNHAGHTAEAAADGSVHEAMAQIADFIVENGEGLTLESLIKAFWRVYSTPEGNIVSIHEGRGMPLDVPTPEDAFARLSGRMDQIAESLGFLTDRVDQPVPSPDGANAAASYRGHAAPTEDRPSERRDLEPRQTAGTGAFDDLSNVPNRRHRDDDTSEFAEEIAGFDLALPDRATFNEELERNYRIARNEVEPLSVAICSVSRIDAIVKDHGLETAQRLLERVASTLSSATKGECYSARKSNSEFIMLARGITISQFCDVLEESIVNLAARRWHDKYSNETLGMVDMHIGVAHVFDFANPSQAMRAADLAHERALGEHTSNVVIADTRDLARD